MTEKMRPEIKTLWVDALKSGKYKQNRGKLKNNATDSYCCLGVLCDLYRKRRHRGKWNTSRLGSSTFSLNNGEGSTTALPPTVAKWAGIAPSVAVHSPQGVLITFNDIRRKTFTHIAKYIEEKL